MNHISKIEITFEDGSVQVVEGKLISDVQGTGLADLQEPVVEAPVETETPITE